MWGVFYYFNTTVPTLNKKPFLTFVILPPYFCSDLSFINFSYLFLYYSYLSVTIFYNVMNFEFKLFLHGEYFGMLVYYFILIGFLYQTIILIFPHFTLMFSNKTWFLMWHHFVFLSFLFQIQFSWKIKDFISQMIFRCSYVFVLL